MVGKSDMSDFTALLRAVLTEPDEDTPRLAMADWYGENGDEARAEFVRVQCELHRRCFGGWTPTQQDVDDMEPLRRRERELLADGDWRNADAWFHFSGLRLSNIWGGPPGHRHPTLALRPADGADGDRECVHCSVCRGFVESVTCTAADWLAHADAIVWPPTVACGHCAGREPGSPDAWKMRHPCRVCTGTGRVPNPDPPPPTAVPVKVVRLTTEPEVEVSQDGPQSWLSVVRWPGGTRHYVSSTDVPPARAARLAFEKFARDRWPGVEVVPPHVVTGDPSG
jgi:uncharacterized protein (TIGR02996 family)